MSDKKAVREAIFLIGELLHECTAGYHQRLIHTNSAPRNDAINWLKKYWLNSKDKKAVLCSYIAQYVRGEIGNDTTQA